jgi:hypothetical protein
MYKRRRMMIREMDKARSELTRVSLKTCPASRHAQIIAEGLMQPGNEIRGVLAAYEPDHMGESIASVVTSLWRARLWLTYKDGEWVPDLEAIDAWRKTPP